MSSTGADSSALSMSDMLSTFHGSVALRGSCVGQSIMTYALAFLCVPAGGEPARNPVKSSPITKFFHLLSKERCLSDIGTRHTAFARVRTMLDRSARLDEDTERRPVPSLLPLRLSAQPSHGQGRFACSCMASIHGVASPRFADTVIGKSREYPSVGVPELKI